MYRHLNIFVSLHVWVSVSLLVFVHLSRLGFVWFYFNFLEIRLTMKVQSVCLLHNDDSSNECNDSSSQHHVECSITFAVILLK